MTAKSCASCGGTTSHVGDCPELYWLEMDGSRIHRRGEMVSLRPLPPRFAGNPRDYRYANPGGMSPVTEMWATIKQWSDEAARRDPDA